MLDDGGVETPFNESCYNMRERLKVLARQVQGLKVLCVEEVTYAYVGTTEGTPHYRVLVADAGRVRAD